MKYRQRIIIILVLILIYVIFINLFASLFIKYSDVSEESQVISGRGSQVNVGMSESVSVQVIRKSKILWKTYEYNGNSYLKLFHFIKLPKKIGGHNFFLFHSLFLIILILISIPKRNVYKEQYPY